MNIAQVGTATRISRVPLFIANTHRSSQIKMGISQHILRALYRCFISFGIFAPVGAYSIKEGGFQTWGSRQGGLQANPQFNIFKEEFSV